MGTMVNGPKITALYYCIETGTMKEFDPTKTTLDDLRKLAVNTPSIFIS